MAHSFHSRQCLWSLYTGTVNCKLIVRLFSRPHVALDLAASLQSCCWSTQEFLLCCSAAQRQSTRKVTSYCSLHFSPPGLELFCNSFLILPVTASSSNIEGQMKSPLAAQVLLLPALHWNLQASELSEMLKTWFLLNFTSIQCHLIYSAASDIVVVVQSSH